jgi:hypothetical protein
MDGVISFSTGTAVIGLSTRFDRMDTFVFTLLHEIIQFLLGHVRPGDLNIDEGIDDTSEQSDREQQAMRLQLAGYSPTPGAGRPVISVLASPPKLQRHTACTPAS